MEMPDEHMSRLRTEKLLAQLVLSMEDRWRLNLLQQRTDMVEPQFAKHAVESDFESFASARRERELPMERKSSADAFMPPRKKARSESELAVLIIERILRELPRFT